MTCNTRSPIKFDDYSHDSETTATPPPPLHGPLSKRIEDATNLESITMMIINAFNNRDHSSSYGKYATADFLFLHEPIPGTLLRMDASAASQWMRYTACSNAEHWAEVLNSSVELAEEGDRAVVWVSLRIHDRPGGFMPGAEKMAIFHWRRGVKRDRRLGYEWRLFKHLCTSAMPSGPY